MRTGAAAAHQGYFHEAAFYGSDDELLAVVTPFVAGGIAAGEPTMVALDDRSTAVVRAAIGDPVGVTFLPHRSQYDRPALTLKRYRDILDAMVAEGASQVRAVGSVPHPGLGAPWDAWARYEAAVHRGLADVPLWGLCTYDTRTAPPDVLADAQRMHPFVATADGGHGVNGCFVAPEAAVARRPAPPPDPLQARRPAVELRDPPPGSAREAVRDAARRHTALDGTTIDDLLVGLSEGVANAIRHGRPPVVVRAWTAPDRMVVTITDRGPGPSDPLVGLIPASAGPHGGFGLWLAHQLCSDVSLITGDDGFTLRLTACGPAPHAC